jgi:hypothetical protein
MALPINTGLSLLMVRWMTWSSTKAPSYFIRGSPEMKLVKLKDIALATGLCTEKKLVIIKR